MSSEIPKYASAEVAMGLLGKLGYDFAVTENPSYAFPRYEVTPLAAPRTQLERGLLAAVMDMDGTTTTTEPLCLHSLEMMVRRITGRESDGAWPGLDKDRDYPHIIGNSTTKHVEYLMKTYSDDIDLAALRRFTVHAAAWTLGHAADPGRREEVRTNLAALGLRGLTEDARFRDLQAAPSLDTPDARVEVDALAEEYGSAARFEGFSDVVRAAIDIYYQRYHHILGLIAEGQGADTARSILGSANQRLIEPMGGVGVFLAMLKGWLGAEARAFHGQLAGHLESLGEEAPSREAGEGALAALGRHFQDTPVRLAVVTSSIRYEAEIVLGEVFRVLAEKALAWPVSADTRQRCARGFEDFRAFYDAFVTASDSSEIRLKPHRDLYSLALHRMGVAPADFDRVAGFEDSESGTIAIRTAGVGLCVALPFPETRGHTFHAATHVAQGGLPEVMLRERVFLPEGLLARS